MNKLLLGLGAILLWKIFKLEEQVKSSEAAVIDIIQDFDETLSANIAETAACIGDLYQDTHMLQHQHELMSLDYLKHLQLYSHWDPIKKDIVQAEPYVVGAPDCDELEMEMMKSLKFETRRVKGN